MARILTCGFETRQVNESGMALSGAYWGGGRTTPTGLGGGTSFGGSQGGAGGGTRTAWSCPLPNSPTEIYLSSAYRQTGGLSNSKLRTWDSSNNPLVFVIFAPEGNPILTVNGINVETSPLNAPPVGWALQEAWIRLGINGRVVYKLNGITYFDWSGAINGDYISRLGGEVVPNSSNPSQGHGGSWDDICVNDTSGSTDNSWIGDRYILGLRPNANGDASQWVGSDGNQTDNYALVNQVPVNTTVYVQANTLGQRDLYNIEPLPTLSTEYTIRNVFVSGYGIRVDAAGDQGVLLGLKTNGGVDFDPNIYDLTVTGNFIGSRTWALNPITGVTWTKADIDALQVGIEIP